MIPLLMLVGLVLEVIGFVLIAREWGWDRRHFARSKAAPKFEAVVDERPNTMEQDFLQLHTAEAKRQ